MRKIIVSEMVSVDGFFSGPKGELDWHNVDAEFQHWAAEQLNAMDTILFGRVTYEGMVGYWPNASTKDNIPEIIDKMNNLHKVVISKTLQKANWNNSSIASGDLNEEIMKLKQQPGKDVVIFGSGKLVSGLAKLGLVDEYRLTVNPVVLGSGVPLFRDMKKRIRLKLIKTKTFKSGNVLLYYRPAKYKR
ncbi:MAG: dihydrofolate reductase [Candidatus Micrarchaeota archaeon]|nr:dihydrofolate reductase [Candidatus Micrarchaeota archaeon]